ncbi:MAG: sensor histidine kinase [Aggregatilineales bacterium]
MSAYLPTTLTDDAFFVRVPMNSIITILLIALAVSVVLLVAALVLLSREAKRRRQTENKLIALSDAFEQRLQAHAAELRKSSEQRAAVIEVANARLNEQAQQAQRIAEQHAARLIGYELVTSALSEAVTVTEVIDVIITQGVSVLGAASGLVVMFTADGTMLEIAGAIGYSPEAVAQWQQFSVDTPSLLTRAIEQQQPVWLRAGEETDEYATPLLVADPNRSAWAAIPLTANGQVFGGLGLSFTEQQTFTDDGKVVFGGLGLSFTEQQAFTDDGKVFLITLARKCSQALQRIRLLAEVRAQRERYRVTLSSIGDAVIATDAVGRITFINEVAQSLTKWKNDEAIGAHLKDVFKIVSEVTHEEVENTFTRVVRKGGVIGLENHTLLIVKDGSEIPIDDSGAPIRDEAGNIIGVILIFRDITNRRRQEAELEATLQRTQDLYETCHQIGMVYDANAVLRAQFKSRYLNHVEQACVIGFDEYWEQKAPGTYDIIANLKPAPSIPGLADDRTVANSPLISLFSPAASVFINDVDTDPRIDSYFRALLQQSGVRSLIIYPLTAHGTAPGKSFGLLAAYFATPTQWTTQDYRHVETFIDQISVALDNIHLLREEKQAREEAERANALRLKFLAMISHELRTPLTSIKGFVTTLLATDVTWDVESQHEFLNIINDEADRLTELIAQLLDLSRLEVGTLGIHPEPKPLSEIVNTAYPQLEVMVADHHLVIGSQENLPLIMADTQRMAQVLVNLVGNAVKYSPPGTNITISFVSQPDFVQINVSDQGAGIPLKDRDRVFEAFSQLEPIGEQRMKGAGLGLAICKGLVEAHGGKIWIADQPDQGTTVAFTLPIAATAKTQPDGKSTPTSL